jgi:hypothetical protein
MKLPSASMHPLKKSLVGEPVWSGDGEQTGIGFGHEFLGHKGSFIRP